MTAVAVSVEETCDVLVVGSGGAALVAALTAAAGGLDVIVAEKTEVLGGTTAISGAGIWVPANRHAREAGIDDSPEQALAYIRAAAPEGWAEEEDPLWQRFVAAAPAMLDFVEAATPLCFALSDDADPLLHLEGARRTGRMVSPRPLRRRVAGVLARRLRRPPLPHLFTYQEVRAADVFHHPVRAVLAHAHRLVWRLVTGRRGKGTALIAGLVAGCLANGCRFRLGAKATGLLTDAAGDVTGALVETGDARTTIRARRGVVLASGGFEWDAERLARHFPGPVDLVGSPHANTGDAHRMAEAVGARLARMDQANIAPAIPAVYDGRPHGFATFHHREPNAILVGPDGRRFANEYLFNLGEVLDARDPASGLPRHLPAFLVTDSRFFRRSPVIARFLRRAPGWVVTAATIEALAARISVPVEGLADTVARFNAFAATGQDLEFQREQDLLAPGGTDPGRMDRICRPPYAAMPFNRSFLGTKGGPRTDADGAVLRADGRRIGGLYAAGLAMANPFGTRAVGSGTTIGPNMTWGYVCGLSLVAGKPRPPLPDPPCDNSKDTPS
ncbi:FAD-dependent oxidoreductase [Methylobrevis pamukkalensis]|uniref:3-oxosteroid 1-dehydrogenase n=1 Tax=Methylobrevis pamukkalensis TaxID=1439726 RepID=A0A1E3H435_9HYPH|nr:FAD-dependent oxidoreductase [Methylobrevis pamukkalensis]ODN71070.1 3-oxosteroid 1-dehydrogenase [Methylobrevis pamukkalensis]